MRYRVEHIIKSAVDFGNPFSGPISITWVFQHSVGCSVFAMRRPLALRKFRRSRLSVPRLTHLHLRFVAALSGGVRCARYRGVRQAFFVAGRAGTIGMKGLR